MSTKHSFQNPLVLRAIRYIYALSLGIQLIFLIIIALNLLVFQVYTVQGNSMLPTFHTGQHLLVNRLAYLRRDPEDQDLVVFTYGSGETVSLVKRVRGVPGETVVENSGTLVLGRDQFFMRGDNPPQSTDSRTFGPVSKAAIIGKIICPQGPLVCLGK